MMFNQRKPDVMFIQPFVLFFIVLPKPPVAFFGRFLLRVNIFAHLLQRHVQVSNIAIQLYQRGRYCSQ